MASDPLELSRRERQIMDVIYRLGEASAVNVAGAIADPPSHTAVRTLLRILERKGRIVHRKRGREFIYSPKRPRGKAARAALRGLLATFFDNSLERAVASYMADPTTRLSDDELRRLTELINDARRRGE